MLRQAEHDVARERPKWHDYRKNHPSYYPGTRVNEYPGVIMLRFTIRAALLDGSIYEELRERRETTFHALLSVLIGAAGFGIAVWRSVPYSDAEVSRNLALFFAISIMIIAWYAWAAIVWLLGVRLFGGEGGFRSSVRAIGVCYAPLLLWVFMDFHPLLSVVALATGGAWVLVATVVAVKYALNIRWWQASVSAGIGWLWGVAIIPWVLIAFIASPTA